MTTPNNILQQVATYNDAQLGYLKNLNCFVSTLNTKFVDFPSSVSKNLGQTVNIELPNRATSGQGLVVSFDGVEQRLQPLTCDQAGYSANAFTAQDFVFNAKDYMTKFGMTRTMELSTQVEANVALNATSSVPVMTVVNGQSVPTGALHTESGPYRFYGDGVTPISSFGQLAKMEALFRNYGSASGELQVYFDDIAVVDIVNSGLSQFVLDRNEKIANSWDLGTYKGSNARYYKSNLLPIHLAGTVGNSVQTLTLVSTNDSTGANITQLTFSGATADDANAIKAGDLLQFQDGVGSFTNLRYLTFIGHKPSKNPVQFRATADAAANGSGNVTINIFPALVSVPGKDQNLNTPLLAGMQVKALPSHRAGVVVSGKAFYLAMPPLPDYRPYDSKTSTDSDTGVSLRSYFGNMFGQNQSGYVNDLIWASTLVPEYSMRVVFPLS
jgi:hypothetical protein